MKWDPHKIFRSQSDDVMHLMMDNAGGHGSNEAVEKYTEDLKNKYKIEIIQHSASGCLCSRPSKKGASRSEE